MTQREWRQQVLVTSLIASALTLVTLSALTINNISRADPDYGSANRLVKVATNGQPLDAATVAALLSAGPAGLSSWRLPVVFLGQASSEGLIEFSDLGLSSPLGATNLRLITGRMPTEPGEIALTPRLRRTLSSKVGSEVTLTGEGEGPLTVVGIVEDPNDLSRRLAVVAPGQVRKPSFVIGALRIDDTQLASLKTKFGDRLLRSAPIEPGGSRVASYFAIALLAGVAMLEVGLLCSAGFAVLARRRLRQFGMLSALGASERGLRVTMTVTGVIVGALGATIGIAAGFLASLALRGRFENWLGWRFASWGLPLAVVAPLLVLAVGTSALAAWWPARSISRLSIVNALAARRPVSQSAKRSATVAMVAAVGGAALLNWGVATVTVLAAFIGLLVALGGVLLLAPTLIRQIGKLSAHLPLSARIAGRDLARHQTRSASALAAIVLALGIPLGIVLSSSSAEAQLRHEPPNLPAHLALLFQRDAGGRNEPPPRSFDSETETVAVALAQMQGLVPGSRVVPIQMAHDPTDAPVPITYATGVTAESVSVVRIQVPMGDRNEPTWADAVWVATPELLAAWKLDPALAERDELLGPKRADLRVGSPNGWSSEVTEPIEFGLPQHPGAAPYWIPEGAIASRKLATVTVGWAIVARSSITSSQRAALRSANADMFSLDLPDPPGSEASIRLVASLIAYGAGLAVLAMTVGLIRSEAKDEKRILAAVGAPARTQRWIAGATAGLLSVAGSILAVPIGLCFLLAMTSNPSGKNPFTVPWRNLTVIPLGIPLIAIIGACVLTSTRTAYEARK